jgi:hypothetical protein
MAAKKLLRNVAGRITEIVGTVTSAGAGNDGDFPVLDATGRLDITMMPVGIGAATKSVVSSENLVAGNLVNVYDNAGTPTVRKADATAVGKEANGFVLAGTTSPASATVYLAGTITGLSGLVAGTRYYLSTTPGATTATSPSAAGNISMFIGVALSATELVFDADDPITVA